MRNFVFFLGMIAVMWMSSCDHISPAIDKNPGFLAPVPAKDTTAAKQADTVAINSHPRQETTTTVSGADTSFVVKVFKSDAPHNGYGYDIFHNGVVYVHQPHIPALPGNRDFETAQQAMEVGKLMLEKIQKGTLPPSVSVEELKKIGIQ